MILVVGATGQLGSLVVRRLRQQGRPVRALVRSGSAAADLGATGAQIVRGDLLDPEPLLAGVEAVVATASAVAPTRPQDTEAALQRGYAALLGAAGDRRVVFASVPVTELDEAVPALRTKRRVEALLGPAAVSVRMAPFTEVWLALVGSSVLGRGEERNTVDRAYPFLRRFRRLTGRTVEDRGVLVLPGPATNRNAFLSVTDAAAVLVAAVDADLTGAVEVGGPEVLSWVDVSHRFSDALGRRIRIVSVPAGVFTIGQRVLTPRAPSAANVLGMNRLLATLQTDWDTSAVTDKLGVRPLRTVAEVLAAR